jgi:hypothetical protein
MAKYLLKAQNVYRGDTVDEALELRDQLESCNSGELVSFTYTTKYIKIKGDVVGEYQIVKAVMQFNEEKEPESMVDAKYEVTF